jgi:cell cycle checkpoint protein
MIKFTFQRGGASIISGKSDFGVTEVQFQSTSDLMEYCECALDQLEVSYRLSLIASLEKALVHSSKVSVRVNEQGLLSIQLIVPLNSKTNTGLIEFLCLPLMSDDNDDHIMS